LPVNQCEISCKATHFIATAADEKLPIGPGIFSAAAALTTSLALTTIGLALGARAFKPDKHGRCDSAWLWGTSRWLTVEAKSEEGEEKTISIDDIRQATAHLAMLASDEGLEMPPIGSVSVIASPRSTVSPDAIPAAGSHLYVAELLDMSALAADVKAAWTVLVATSFRGDSQAIRASVAGTLADFGCLPSQVIDRLTRSPVNP
jgi:hypothetical protein